MESDQLFDCTVKRRQLMGQIVYKSDVGYRSILLYLFQLNYNYKSAFVMSNTFQRTFQHLVDVNTVLQSVIPPLPPLQRAPTQAPSSLPAPALSPPSTTDQEIKIIQTVQIDPLLGYFERTWIAGLNGRAARYPPASWNQTDRVETELNRTNNYCESFNKTFSSVVGHAHPTIYNFLSAVHLEQASTEGKMHSYRRGVQPPKRKRRYLEKDTRLKHIVSSVRPDRKF